MKIQTRRQGDITVIDLEGHLDFEATQQFQQTATQLLEQPTPAQVVFNLSKLKFVGSSGIGQFIKVLKKLNNHRSRPKLCSLSSEFLKMFKAYQTSRNPLQIFDDEIQAVESFLLSPEPRPSRRRKVVNN